jgi:hypothetical protein
MVLTLNRFLALAACLILSLAFGLSVFANDSAVEVTPAGLQFMHMRDISMEKEDLFISLDRIEVSYVFRNNSPRAVATEIAFPVPDYTWAPFGYSVTDFHDFKVEVNGAPLAYATEARALAGGKECTDMLKEMNIPISNFGGFDLSKDHSFIDGLSPGERKRLTDAGALKSSGGPGAVLLPAWSVRMKYHWRQVFPPDAEVSVKHSYKPYYGFAIQSENDADGLAARYKDGCMGSDVAGTVRAFSNLTQSGFHVAWVSYILTTGRNWKGPIKEFHLTVKKKNDNDRMSSCFSPEIARSGTVYDVHIRDFVPDRDIKVYFYGPNTPLP